MGDYLVAERMDEAGRAKMTTPKTPTRAEALAALDRLSETTVGIEPSVVEDFKTIRAALATDAPIVEGLGKDIEDRFSYMNQNDVKAIADYVVYRLYAQGRTQGAVPEGWREPKLLDELAFDNGDEILVELRGCDSGKLRKAVLVWDSRFDEWRFDGSEVSNAWSITRWLPISAAPPVTGSAWLPIDSAPEGKDILVYCQETGECFVVFWALQVDTRKGDWVIARADDGTCFICKNPTHWMPLPSQPESGE